MRNRKGLPGDQKDCTKILGNPQIAREHSQLPQNQHPFAIAIRAQSATHPKPWQCRHNLLQSWGLWWNCRFQAIQPQGPTDCNQQSGLALFCSSSQIAAQSTQNQLHQTGSQLDCRTTKDCKAIGRIALKLHGLQVDCNNCVPRRGIDQQQSNPFSDIPEPIMQVWSNIISPSRSWNNQQNPTNQCAKCWN